MKSATFDDITLSSLLLIDESMDTERLVSIIVKEIKEKDKRLQENNVKEFEMWAKLGKALITTVHIAD